MRRLFAILLLCVLGIFTMPVVASAASVSPIVNVKYVHDAIRTKWNLDIPYNPNLSSPSAAANMRYVLGMVDRANARFGVETNYGTGEYATSAAANQNTTNQAIETLIQKPIEFPFSVTTTPDTKTFSFKISASGTFYVDWGDGSDVDEYVKNYTSEQEISHTYTTAGAYTVRLGGRATGYASGGWCVAAISFSSNTNLAGISGSLGEIFPTLADGSQPRFCWTFYNSTNLTGSIPENLFAGISGAPADDMFSRTFSWCNRLTGIPEKLFAGISGAPAESMFDNTFSHCSGLTEIPENLFAGISGAPASSMFYETFSDCSGLTEIPENLFAGISGAPASDMFSRTFSGCSGLTGEIPSGLFGDLSGAPADSMFFGTFSNCSGLTGEIPSGLFGDLSGAPARAMFSNTFYNCSGLTGEIPSGLFGNLSGAPAESMFDNTFSHCSGLTGEIPSGLFGDLSGAPADSMFFGTFSNCSGLTGEIPSGLFGDLSGAPARAMFSNTFYNCSGLIGKSARNPDGTPLYDVFPTATMFDVGGMYDYTCLDDDVLIPGAWGKTPDCASAEPEYSFFATTTSDTTEFVFHIAATGKFYVDWGDGGDVDKYVNTDTGLQTISHTYTTAGAYTVRLGGRATGYASWWLDAAISFSSNTNLAGIDGSLGAIFPTLADGTQPRFVNTFSSCSGLTGSIPENLFAGISGAPASNMFNGTFYMCSGLTGEIPEKLFAGISGAPASGMFSSTFNGCSGLTGSIPENLFAGISGAPAEYMFSSTFNGCSGLTGSIPENLFAGISGAPAEYMFRNTFSSCSGLTGSIPEKLFAGISGAPAEYMFDETFNGCSGLTGSIPEKLFAGISGAPADSMFRGTFDSCSGLTGTIPEKLFAGISGAPAWYMFQATFYNCSGLTGISGSLFAGISGAPASDMFSGTFYNCVNLTGEIPVGLFGNLSGTPAYYMFRDTFYNCSGLTGKSARNPDGTPLYDVFPTATWSDVGGMYTGTCLADNASIPDDWGRNASCVYSGPTE